MRSKTPAQQHPIVIHPPVAKAALTIVEAAEMLSIGTTATRALINQGRIKVVRLGRSIIVPLSEIHAFLARETAS